MPLPASLAPLPGSTAGLNGAVGVELAGQDQGKTDGAGDPCPAPLNWQDVRQKYLQESAPWELIRHGRRILGRVWGHGPPIYFLNNFAATAELYALAAWLLKDQFRCILFDSATSEGTSFSRNSPTGIAGFADEVVAIAEQFDDREITIYGAGFGAAVALQTCADHPDRIARMILQHGFAVRRLSFFERILAGLCSRSKRSLDELPQRRRFQAVNHQPWFPPFDQSRFQFLIESTGTLPLRELSARATAVNLFNLVSRLSEINCPVLLLRTEGEGRVAAESQEFLAANLKNSQTEWLHSAGQHPCLTHPHRVAKLVTSFCLSSVHPGKLEGAPPVLNALHGSGNYREHS